MKTILLTLLGIAFSTTTLHGQETGEVEKKASAQPVIMDSKTGAEIELDQLVNELIRDDVVFLGEKHGNDAGHTFQLDVIKALANKGVDVVISMEQFERDVQGVVNDYLAGRIQEDEFLATSRPWKNYDKHYRPIIEFAKQKHIPVLAGNVPRSLAAKISKGETTELEQQVYLPRSTTAPENRYWQHFSNTMRGHLGADGAEKLKKFYASQCVKDDAMAESITDYLAVNQHKRKLVVHLCGHFHSDYGLGTAARVVQRYPLSRIAVVTIETIPEEGKQDTEEVRSRGHYVFWTVENASKKKSPDEKN